MLASKFGDDDINLWQQWRHHLALLAAGSTSLLTNISALSKWRRGGAIVVSMDLMRMMTWNTKDKIDHIIL